MKFIFIFSGLDRSTFLNILMLLSCFPVLLHLFTKKFLDVFLDTINLTTVTVDQIMPDLITSCLNLERSSNAPEPLFFFSGHNFRTDYSVEVSEH